MTPAVVLPAIAIYDAGGTPYALVVREGRAVRQTVKLGLKGEAAVELLDGVAEGEIALIGANAVFKPGRRVRVAWRG